MTKLKSFLKMSLEGVSLRKMSELTNTSRKTLTKYKELFDKLPQSYEELLLLSDHELYMTIDRPMDAGQSYKELYEYFPTMASRLLHVGVTKLYLWEEYKSAHPDCVQYSQFCKHFSRFEASQKLSYVFEHKVGDKLMIDFAGKKLELIDPDTGEVISVEFFVAILACSQYCYAEAVRSQKSGDFLGCLSRTLEYMEGVPNAIVTDNLKPAVNKASKYDPEINRSMADFAAHYDTVVLPTRARKPKDKALVESAVNILYKRIYAPLHGIVFYTLRDLNEAIWSLLAKHNETLFQGKTVSRKGQFESLEKDHLKPLPAYPFELKVYQEAKVHPNCHVFLSEDKHNYSVPYKYVGEKMCIGYTSQTVEIYHKLECIATHQRNRNNYKYTTNSVHLHPQHRYYKNWSEDFFLNQGTAIGEYVRLFIEQIFLQCKHPEQGYKTCQGVLQLAQKYGKEHIEVAASLCLQYDLVSYTRLERILNIDYYQIIKLKGEPENLEVELNHDNIRGQSYYQ